jgi:hypothetical protein
MSEQIMRENLLVLAQTYATANGWSLSTVSKMIHGNQAFLSKFLAGEISTTIKTYYGMIEYLRMNWPKGTDWPVTQDIVRPMRRVSTRRDLPPRDDDGKFLGKKVEKRGAHA